MTLNEHAEEASAEQDTVGTAAASSSTTKTPRWQTRVRQSITPYLPPPVIQSIQTIDLQLESHIGPEGTITVASTLLVGWLVFNILRFFTSRLSGQALADDDDVDVAASGTKFNATVLLVGPSGGGKTRLFHRLVYGKEYAKTPTVMSLKANVGYSKPSPETDNMSVRYMDWPGYASLSDSVITPFLVPSTRMLLVLDSSQPVAAAADVLYDLLTTAHAQKKKNNMQILVACNKSDFPKAKNWRRIKIQMRTELERLLKVKSSKGEEVWWPAGEPLTFDQVSGARIVFLSTSCEGKFSEELLSFCQTGILPVEPE